MKGPPKILIIDDDESIRKVLASLLQNKGYIVDTAKDGEEAIKKTSINFYNLALIDIKLPDMEGIHLLNKLKDTTPKMMKIILTGYPSLENAIEAVNKGADGYLIKPVNVGNLLKKIEDLLKKQEELMLSEDKVAQFIETRVKQLGRVPRAH
ncbi:MAG: response regulator [Candidatus Bathyarchaeia archaeon]